MTASGIDATPPVRSNRAPALERSRRRPPEETSQTSPGRIDRAESSVCLGDAGTPAVESLELLARQWPLSDLPDEILRAVFEQMETREYGRGETLIEQGHPSRGLMLVVRGRLRICVADEERSYEIARSKAGTILGEIGLISGEPCTASAVALTPVRVLVLPTGDFHRLSAAHPVLRAALGHLAAARLGRGAIDTLVGKVVHGYRVRRCVGRGGMGVVYEAEPLAGGSHVALKMMSHRLAHDLDSQKRFAREVQICRSLRHPNIARVLDQFTSFGTNFMTMEFCEGRPLDALIRDEGPLCERRVKGLAGQLARALAYAHRRNICHRDVKPSNIMVGADDSVKLMDFGLAKSTTVTDGITRPGLVIGTPHYMPPEQLAGEPVDHRADVYALGCVIYEMLTGRSPFFGEDLLSVLQKQLTWSLPAPKTIRRGLSPEIYQVLQRSLAADPRRRRLSCQRLARAWAKPS